MASREEKQALFDSEFVKYDMDELTKRKHEIFMSMKMANFKASTELEKLESFAVPLGSKPTDSK